MTVAADPVIEGPAALRPALAAELETLASDVGARTAGGSPTLVSVAIPLRGATPLDWFEMARDTGADVACWMEQPSGRALVGIGAATSVSLFGPDRFREAAAAWDAWSRDAVVGGPAAGRPGAGPILLGGATFADGDSSDACWAGFERGRLDVPELLLAVVDGETTLTVSLVIRDPAQAVADIGALLRRVDHFLVVEPPRQQRSGTAGASTLRTIGSHPDRATWSSSVARAAGAVGRGRIDKVVLARRADLRAPTRIDADAVLARLAAATDVQPSAAPVTVFAFGRADGRSWVRRPNGSWRSPAARSGPSRSPARPAGTLIRPGMAGWRRHSSHPRRTARSTPWWSTCSATRWRRSRTTRHRPDTTRRAAADAPAPRHRHQWRAAGRPGHPGPRGPAAPDAGSRWLAAGSGPGAARGAGASRPGLVRRAGRLGGCTTVTASSWSPSGRG